MTHINPGTDTTINPVIINDTHRERQHSSEQSMELYTQKQLQQILDVVRENAVYDDGDFYFKVDVDKITKVVHSLEPLRTRAPITGSAASAGSLPYAPGARSARPRR